VESLMGCFRPRLHRNRRIALAATADSGEECRRPGGAVEKWKGGGRERRCGSTYRRRPGRSSRPESMGLNSKKISLRFLCLWKKRLEEGDDPVP
jgi:hypothetical protein